MTTYTCDICSEEKTLSQMTLCKNGHFGGCQKCHMEFVKVQYKKTFKVYGYDNSVVQKCMYCREKMYDHQMGEDWGIKLSKLQPIMMAQYLNENCENVNIDLKDVIASKAEQLGNVKSFKYNIFEELVETFKDRNSVKALCKVIQKSDAPDFVELFMSYLDVEESDDDDDEEIEVERININGKEYYMTDDKVLYDPETQDLIGIFDNANNTVILGEGYE